MLTAILERVMARKRDVEILEFEAALMRSVDQALERIHAAVHTPEQIAARKRNDSSADIRTGDPQTEPVPIRPSKRLRK